jgi:aminoglycoside phosphotransferase (APT) family kinase protein
MISAAMVSTADILRGLDMARTIIERHIGGAPQRLAQQPGGLRNLVYAAKHREGDFIVRISFEPERIAAYQKELLATIRARAEGIPAPEVLHVGEMPGSFPYSVQRRARGRTAIYHPDRWRIVREMGRYAALINSIPTLGFGYTFHWRTSGQVGLTWKEFLETELKLDARLEALSRYRIMTVARLERLRAILQAAALASDVPALNHGDLRLKNVLVDHTGTITAIVDWEDCASLLAPHWEWSVALHDLTIDEKQWFLEGYGASESRVAELAPVIKALNIINYVPMIERLVAEQGGEPLGWIRTRLSGALDLYSL